MVCWEVLGTGESHSQAVVQTKYIALVNRGNRGGVQRGSNKMSENHTFTMRAPTMSFPCLHVLLLTILLPK